MQVQEAVRKAKEYLPTVFGTPSDADLLLEGIERSEDGRFWKVAFSYGFDATASVPLAGLRREYKTVKIRNEDGEFVGAQNGRLLEGF